MRTEEISRDCQRILVHNFEKRVGFLDGKRAGSEMKGLLQEMQHIVRTYPLDDDIIDAMSAIVDRVMAVITVNAVYTKSNTYH